jgi:hypothetical protein
VYSIGVLLHCALTCCAAPLGAGLTPDALAAGLLSGSLGLAWPQPPELGRLEAPQPGAQRAGEAAARLRAAALAGAAPPKAPPPSALPLRAGELVPGRGL